MSDLISRSDVLELLYKIFDKYRMSTDKNTSIGKSFGTDVFEEIKNMPTAYDIDKVVEELEKNGSRYTKKYVTPYGNNGYRDVKAISVHKAIEIVKQGGVSDDVCEWKSASDGEFIKNPHTKRLFSNEPSMKNVYCNTCGKKIKVVE